MAEQNDDHRKYLEEKFNSINNLMNVQFDNINNKLQSIEEQTKKTNVRVTKLEQTVVDIQLSEAKHTYNCPQNKRFDDIEKALAEYKREQEVKMLEYNFFKKYPKSFIAGIAVVVILLLLSYNIGLTSFKNTTQNQAKIENTK